MKINKPSYSAQQKANAVLDLLKGKTIEQVCIKYGCGKTALARWKKTFENNIDLIFDTEIKSKSVQQEKDSPEYLKSIIGKQAVEIDILKKACGVWM